MISWISKTEVCVICRSRRLTQITQTRGFENSWYHAKTEFNNCFIIHFSLNSSSETEAKRSAILFLKRTLQGLSNQADIKVSIALAVVPALLSNLFCLHFKLQVTSGTWISTRDPATEWPSCFVRRCVVLLHSIVWDIELDNTKAKLSASYFSELSYKWIKDTKNGK